MRKARSQGAAAVTVASPEKRRSGAIGWYQGTPGQDWPGAAVAAASFFEGSRSGWDQSTAAAPRKAGDSNPFVDPDSWNLWVKQVQEGALKNLEMEKQKAAK